MDGEFLDEHLPVLAYLDLAEMLTRVSALSEGVGGHAKGLRQLGSAFRS